jgi:hypothetical protein
MWMLNLCIYPDGATHDSTCHPKYEDPSQQKPLQVPDAGTLRILACPC